MRMPVARLGRTAEPDRRSNRQTEQLGRLVRRCGLAALLLLSLPCAFAADVPEVIAYQGRIATSAGPFTGTGSFKFALVDQAGTTAYWSNDGTSSTGDEPTAPVLIGVQGGLFSVQLGDPAHAGMTLPVPATVFANDHVNLRIWFSASGAPGSFEQLAPDRRMTTAGYAFLAQSVADGAIGDAQVSSLDWSKLSGVPNLVANGGATPAIVAATVAPGSPAVGTLFIHTTNQTIERWDGAAWQLVGSATVGTVGDGQITASKLATGAVGSVAIADGAIVDADVSATAAIAGTKIAPAFGAQTVQSGTAAAAGAVAITDASSHAGTLRTAANLTANRSWTLPDQDGTVAVGSSRVDLQACKLEYSIVSPK